MQDKSIEQETKDRFMLTKGKIHNKEIMYMNLQTLYNMALL